MCVSFPVPESIAPAGYFKLSLGNGFLKQDCYGGVEVSDPLLQVIRFPVCDGICRIDFTIWRFISDTVSPKPILYVR